LTWENSELNKNYNEKVQHDELAFQELESQSREIARDLEEQKFAVENLKRENESNKELIKIKDKELESYEKNLTLLKHEFSKIKNEVSCKENRISELTQMNTILAEQNKKLIEELEKDDIGKRIKKNRNPMAIIQVSAYLTHL